mmetsp:Transcript_29968/g.41496  ORF Transcript_29968/g.41496 Transcript_29968/m.41496 type:complete len:311 (+) Transcript_29968:149-1081(+)|eukprot:CAMPEP_0196580744 /NCGR_PEP_ID=MMETSP1081-20130531/30328_1 /TAXON_ID=36882 /ORGANISM="Pyramimonas amylifera, Strain CCMP720" /LENGTH=310 /DNA_ID=CAMNT_0041900705 /DNA_START=43 /DNA_END=975 /DNA_ORIENTATION=-
MGYSGPDYRNFVRVPMRWIVCMSMFAILAAHSYDAFEDLDSISEDLPDLSFPRDMIKYPNWLPFHKVLSDEAYKWASQKSELDLLFLGDSLTETWRGTEAGLRPCVRCNGITNLWDQEYGHLNAAAFGIASDQTQHLLWRLQNGELPASLKVKVIVILIGTNDLGLLPVKTANETIDGIKSVVKYVRETVPGAQVVVNGILPRGRIRHKATAKVLPIRTNISYVNEELKEFWSVEENINFLDCGSYFLDTQQAFITRNLMPDFLHLSEEGHRVWSQCLRPTLSQWLPFQGSSPFDQDENESHLADSKEEL